VAPVSAGSAFRRQFDNALDTMTTAVTVLSCRDVV
jgi:hypothetical protein